MTTVARFWGLAALLGAVAPAHGNPPDARWERLERGEVLIRTKREGPFERVRAVALLDAPPARVWPLIDRCADYHRTMLRILKSTEVWRRGRRVRCRVVLDMPFPLADVTTETEAIHTVRPGKLWRRTWHQVAGEMRVNEGSWTLRPHDGGRKTLVVYQVMAEPKVAVPDVIRRAARHKTLPALFEHLEAQARRAPAKPPAR